MTAHRLRVRYTTGLCAGGGTLDLELAVKLMPHAR